MRSVSLLDRQQVVTRLVHDIKGLGAIDPLLADPGISDIPINGLSSAYVERHGRLEPIELRFRDERHLFHIAQRIAGRVWRRICTTVTRCRSRNAARGSSGFSRSIWCFPRNPGARTEAPCCCWTSPACTSHLHLQHELIGLFERIADDNQLLYSTHLLFLIDANRMERIRTVYLSGTELRSTRVSNEIRPADHRDTLSPLANQPLTYEDIPWPGEVAPRPQHSRRKGKQLTKPRNRSVDASARDPARTPAIGAHRASARRSA